MIAVKLRLIKTNKKDKI